MSQQIDTETVAEIVRFLKSPQLVGLSVVEGSPVDLSVLTEGTTGSAASAHVVPIPVSKAKC